MGVDPDADRVAAGLRVSIGQLVRRLRALQVEGDLTLSESSVLARLDRGGPTTAAALARLERISPQSVGATLGGLEARGLVSRAPDPHDGRRVTLSITDAGLRMLWNRRTARTERMSRALATAFTRSELEQLMAATPLLERLAQSI